jgi:hypothetical protein
MTKEFDNKIRGDFIRYQSAGEMGADKNALIAKDILHEELGYHPEAPQPAYHFDEATRDRLLAHSRQDAAHALLNTIALREDVRKLNQRSIIVIVLLGIAIVVSIFIQGRH